MRSERREWKTLRRNGTHRSDERPHGFSTKVTKTTLVTFVVSRGPSLLTGLESDGSVAGPDVQRLAAVAELALQRAAGPLAVAFRGQIELVSDRAVARVRVELGAEVRGQVERHAAVAGRDRPVGFHRGPRGRAERDRAVAGVELHGRELAGDTHAAVAGIHVQIPGHVFQRDRSVTRRER